MIRAKNIMTKVTASTLTISLYPHISTFIAYFVIFPFSTKKQWKQWGQDFTYYNNPSFVVICKEAVEKLQKFRTIISTKRIIK